VVIDGYSVLRQAATEFGTATPNSITKSRSENKENHLLSENGEAARKRDPGGDIIANARDGKREWYAVYTMSRHEKRVAAHCERIAIEHFLPLYTWRRSWKNRTTVDLQMPLFPNYIFVQLSPDDHGPLMRLPGVLSTVGNAAGPVAIQDSEMEMLRRIMDGKAIEPHAYITAGDKVRVKEGPLEGIVGVVLRKANGLRFIVTLDLIGKSVALDIESSALELIASANTELSAKRSADAAA
jgi:transcription antitermination factor NusG